MKLIISDFEIDVMPFIEDEYVSNWDAYIDAYSLFHENRNFQRIHTCYNADGKTPLFHIFGEVSNYRIDLSQNQTLILAAGDKYEINYEFTEYFIQLDEANRLISHFGLINSVEKKIPYGLTEEQLEHIKDIDLTFVSYDSGVFRLNGSNDKYLVDVEYELYGKDGFFLYDGIPLSIESNKWTNVTVMELETKKLIISYMGY